MPSRIQPVAGILLILALPAAACATIPITGRRQLSLIPTATLNAMRFDQYAAFISSNPASRDAERTAMVRRVGTRLQAAVERYFRDQGMSRQKRWGSGSEWLTSRAAHPPGVPQHASIGSDQNP